MANTADTSDDLYSLLVLIIAISQEKSMFEIAKKRKCQRQIIYNYPSKRLTQILNFFPGSMLPDPGLLGWAALGGYLSEPPSTNFWIRPRKGFMFVYMNISNKAGKKRSKPAVNMTTYENKPFALRGHVTSFLWK